MKTNQMNPSLNQNLSDPVPRFFHFKPDGLLRTIHIEKTYFRVIQVDHCTVLCLNLVQMKVNILSVALHPGVLGVETRVFLVSILELRNIWTGLTNIPLEKVFILKVQYLIHKYL